MYDYFSAYVRDKQDPPPPPVDPGLYGGRGSLETFREWEFHGRRTMDMFGVAWIELPEWLRQDLIKLVGMLAWHEVDKERKPIKGVRNIDTLFRD